MSRASILSAALLLAVAATAVYAAPGAPAFIGAAVADSARPEADTKRDAERKPAASLAFAGVKSGDHVAELIPGSGYFTRLFSAAVGPNGKVYAVAPPRRPDAPADSPDPAARLASITADAHYGNVTVLTERMIDLALPEPVALIWTSQNYHDIHNITDLNVVDFDKAVFKALKPGGVFIVLDHSAPAGSGFSDTSTLHRIDEEAVKREVESAGFKFEGASDVLRNKDDPRTGKVFDAAVRGHTDQFILKFRKPK